MTRTLSNGYTYQVVENFLGGYSMYFKGANSDKFSRSTKSFRSLNEAEEWFETMEADYIASKNAPRPNYNLPDGAYYSITGYFGD
jgi:hypothetical protein